MSPRLLAALTLTALAGDAVHAGPPELGPKSPKAVEVRVGLVAYEDPGSRLDDLRRYFDTASGSEILFRPRFALGTYAEVIGWIDKGLVDVAVLTSAAFAEMRRPARAEEAQTPRCQCQYLLSEGARPAPAGYPWARRERKENRYHDQTYSVCLVRKESRLRNAADLKRAVEEQRVRILQVDRLSASGRIVPELVFKRLGIRPTPDQVEFTYSHSRSLTFLANHTDPNTEAVAFVFDGAASVNVPDAATRFRALPIRELDEYPIPENVWMARPRYEFAQALQQGLAKVRIEIQEPAGEKALAPGKAPTSNRNVRTIRAFHHAGNAEVDRTYRKVYEWIQDELDLGSSKPGPVEEVVRLLRHYRETHARPPRVALVLSGGGAKCAYQAGAIEVIEQKFHVLGEEIHLVVGTSGGALNALPVALGRAWEPPVKAGAAAGGAPVAVSLTSGQTGSGKLAEVWQEIDLLDFARPPWPVGAALGLWAAWLVLTLAVVACWACRRHGTAAGIVKGLLACGAFLFAGLALLLVLFPWLPADWWDGYLNLRYPYLLLRFGLVWFVGCLGFVLILLLGAWCVLRALSPDKAAAFVDWVGGLMPMLRSTLAWGLLFVFPILLLIAVLSGETVLGGAGVERLFARQYLKLAGDLVPDTARQSADLERLRDLSRAILRDGHLRRDLVITGSCLPPRPEEHTYSDLYFFLPAGKPEERDRQEREAPPRFGVRGIPLAKYEHALFDVVLGSGTLYPGLPSHTVPNVPGPDRKIRLVDGGFAHNSPVEAALQWGATHILLIEASPRPDPNGQPGASPPRLLGNALAAIDHLFEQAQLVDARSREKIFLFILRPEKAHLNGMDFTKGLIGHAIQAGRADARGSNFYRYHGEPRFLDQVP